MKLATVSTLKTTAHPLGGACIGRNINEGVVDGKGEAFGRPGLYVADAAALPKPVEGPPSMTVAARANHVGEQLIVKRQREKSGSFGQPFLQQKLTEKQYVEMDETD